MALLRDLFQNQQAGLTVYSPDCAQSRLWGNLDHAIHAATGFQVVRRHWINHDINSSLRFYRGPNDEPAAEQDPAEAIRRYDSIPAETLQYGHLMVKLLIMGPALVTIWRGDNAIPTLLRLKGTTQPAEAAAGSIRGGFWCDNGVCNLVHSSDDTAEAERELAALNLDHWLDADAGQAPLIDPIPAPQTYVAHSAIAIVCDVVNRVLVAGNAAHMDIHLPPSGSAQETNQQLTRHLRETAARHAATAPFIDAFLAGDLIAVTAMLKSLPVTRWEHFAIQCGAVNRDRWNAAL
jgi:nucleoside diphosphate kinase